MHTAKVRTTSVVICKTRYCPIHTYSESDNAEWMDMFLLSTCSMNSFKLLETNHVRHSQASRPSARRRSHRAARISSAGRRTLSSTVDCCWGSSCEPTVRSVNYNFRLLCHQTFFPFNIADNTITWPTFQTTKAHRRTQVDSAAPRCNLLLYRVHLPTCMYMLLTKTTHPCH